MFFHSFSCFRYFSVELKRSPEVWCSSSRQTTLFFPTYNVFQLLNILNQMHLNHYHRLLFLSVPTVLSFSKHHLPLGSSETSTGEWTTRSCSLSRPKLGGNTRSVRESACGSVLWWHSNVLPCTLLWSSLLFQHWKTQNYTAVVTSTKDFSETYQSALSSVQTKRRSAARNNSILFAISSYILMPAR